MVPSAREPQTPVDPSADNIRAIVELERQSRRHESPSERLGRRTSDFVGTLMFVWLQLLVMGGWIAWNALAPEPSRFDPYPYGLLTVIVSLESVLIATFVLITQNQMSRQSDERDHLNLQVDLLAEQEMTVMLRMLQRISERLGVPDDSADAHRTAQLTTETNVLNIAERLREELPTIADETSERPR
jgi:uncharacterized membrane protein